VSAFDGREAKRERGLRIAGLAPFGYAIHPKTKRSARVESPLPAPPLHSERRGLGRERALLDYFTMKGSG
jgi:hypothetical protein